MAVTSVADLSNLFNIIRDGALFVAREQNLMVNLVDQRSATGWMSRTVSIRPQVTAQSVAETEDFNQPTTFGLTTKATLTPGEVISQVTLTDRNMDTDPHGAVRDAAVELGASIATKIDTDLLSLFASFTTDKGTGAGNAATIASAGAAIAVLSNNKAFQYGQISAVWHPYHWHDLWVELGRPAATYANSDGLTAEALRSYFVADWLGIMHYRSANIAVDGATDAISGIFAPPAIMLDTRRAPRLEQERDASARATEWNMSAGYAYGVVRPEFGVKYTADAATP
jgi:hypothetical protein